MNKEEEPTPQKLYLAQGKALNFLADEKPFIGSIVGEAPSEVLGRVGVHLNVGTMVPDGARLSLPNRTGGCGDAHPYRTRHSCGLDIFIALGDVDPTSPIKG